MKAWTIGAIVCGLLVLTGCGGGSGGGVPSAPATPALTGYLVDAPVQGASYSCGASTGTTGVDGSFLHDPTATCTFKIGNVSLGTVNTVPSDGLVTPYELAGVSRTDAVNANAIAIAQFLQSLDDGSKSGVISIST